LITEYNFTVTQLVESSGT
jgi:hypothetical protein